MCERWLELARGVRIALASALVLLLVPAASAAAATGTVSAWGGDSIGELGNGTTNGTANPSPSAVNGLSNVVTVATAATGDYTLALLANGTVVAWGQNTSGQLGNGTVNSSSTPVPVTGLSGVVAVAAGRDHGLAVLSNGTVMAWGDNSLGELGIGSDAGPGACAPCSTTPVAVPGLSGVTAVAAGDGFSLALLKTGTVVAWGFSSDGQLGNGSASGPDDCGGDDCSWTPVAVSGLSGVTAIAAGEDHALALLANGTVVGWGANGSGQLGDGTFTGPTTCNSLGPCSVTPVPVSGLTGATAIAAGFGDSLALVSGGAVEAWGDNSNGELGDGTSSGPDMCSGDPCSTIPVAVIGLSGAVRVASGGFGIVAGGGPGETGSEVDSLALLSSGTVMAWGTGTLGQLGTASTNSDVPVVVSGLGDVDAITAGAETNFALQSAGGTVLASPANTVRPAISGTRKAGRHLLCSRGSWSGSPTTFTYQWSRDDTPIAGSTSDTYAVQTSDEGLALTCTVTAANGAGAGPPATSAGVSVPVPHIARCPAATGRLSGETLGLVHLGMTRAQARNAYTHSSDRGKKYEDFFCLTPIGVRVGYASPKLLGTLPKAERRRVAGRVIWASTSSAYYAVQGIRAGATVSAARTHLKLTGPFHIGLNFWYLAPNGSSTAVFKVRGGIVEEIGIGDKALMGRHRAQVNFLNSFS